MNTSQQLTILTWWMLVAGKGLNEDVTNGAAARPVGAARELKSKGGERRATAIPRARCCEWFRRRRPARYTVRSLGPLTRSAH